MVLLGTVLVLTAVGAVVETGVGVAVAVEDDESGTGSITEEQKQAAIKARPDVEASYNTRHELQSKYPDFEAAVKAAIEGMHNSIIAATTSGDQADVRAGINQVTKNFKKCQEIGAANPSTLPLPDPMPPAKSAFRTGVQSYLEFLKAFPAVRDE